MHQLRIENRGKIINFIVLYCFLKNFELNLDTISANNPFLTVVLGDFNVKSNLWCKSDKTSCEDSKIEDITSQFGLQQIVNESTHHTRNSSSCIDLIFASKPNLVMESCVHSSLHENRHHQIIYAKFNLKIYYGPPYEREIWHYQKANIENIRKVIDQFPWEMHFTNIDVNEKVNLFKKTMKNIIRNYISHEAITCDGRDPPWINKDLMSKKELIHVKNQAYKSYRQNKNNTFSVHQFELLQSKLNFLIEKSKSHYYARLSIKLSDPTTSPKSCWSIFKKFLNNKKILCIPPLLHDDKFITNFKQKAEIFNSFFTKQCSLINTNSDLPSVLSKKTHIFLSTIRFTSDDILKIVKNLDPNKGMVMIW